MMPPTRPAKLRPGETMQDMPSIYDWRVKTGPEFKASPNLMEEFSSYEEYAEKMKRVLSDMKKIHEILLAGNIEPIETLNPCKQLKRLGD